MEHFSEEFLDEGVDFRGYHRISPVFLYGAYINIRQYVGFKKNVIPSTARDPALRRMARRFLIILPFGTRFLAELI